MDDRLPRKLAAILYADVAGYSRLTGEDEDSTHHKLGQLLDLVSDAVAAHRGQVMHYAGDAVLAKFDSVVDAVSCAVAFQKELKSRNEQLPDDKKVQFRIGINLGEVIEDRGDIYGDGVNVAARLEALAPPGGISISKSVADQVVGKVDVTFASAGSHGLKNIKRPVEVWTWPPELAKKVRRGPKTWQLATTLAGIAAIFAAVIFFFAFTNNMRDLPTGARIAIIPFQNVGNDPEDAYFSEGLTRDLNAQLSKFSNLFVIAPEAGAGYRGEPNCEIIRDELGADYILTGAVRRSLDKLRVTTTFTDAQTCRQLTPPGPFDRDLSVANVLGIQIEIAGKVAAEVGSSDAPLFKAAIQQTIRNKAPDSLDSYECVLLSYWFYQSFGLEAHRKARDCLIRAVEVEPGYSLGWSRLAFTYLESKKRSHDTPPNWAQLAREATNRALDVDPDNPDAYYALAILSRMVGDDNTVFWNYAKKAIDLNPNDSWILADLGIFLAYSGEWEKGKEWISRARALNPKLHPGFGYAWHLHAFVQGDYEEARNVILGRRMNAMSLTSLTATYALNGEQQKAKETLADLRKRYPDHLKDPLAPFRARRMPRDLIEGVMDGLRKAGLDVPVKPDGN